MTKNHDQLARHIAGLFAQRTEVEAIALGGSQGRNRDADSDIDLYVYTRAEIPVNVRIELKELSGGATKASMGLDFWGPGDEWFHAETGIEVDMVYFDAQWMENQIKQVVRDHQASMGYSTCFWFTVRTSQVLHDPNGWFASLQETSQQPYPEPLRQKIIAKNHPVLRKVIPSYAFQIEKAIKRGDLVSVNHRLAGLLASYFDIIFALNRELHPGEKRLVAKAEASCRQLPENMAAEVNAILTSAAKGDAETLKDLDLLLDHLDQLLVREGFAI